MVAELYNIGITTSDMENAIKAGARSISQWIDNKTVRKMEFIDAVNMRPTDVIDIHFYAEDDNQDLGVYEISEGGNSPLSTFKTYEKVIHLSKHRAGVMISDESKIRLDSSFQLMNQMKRSANSFANKRDWEILKTFVNDAGVTDSAQAYWNSSNADVVGDLGGLIEQLFNKDIVKVGEEELGNMNIYYPSKLFTYIRNPVKLFDSTNVSGHTQLVTRSQVNTTDLEFAQGTYGVRFIASHKLNYLGAVVAVIPGEDTADHYTYTGGAIKQTAQGTDDLEGTDYIVNTRYFGTMTYPNNYYDQTHNDRIMKLTGVCAATVPGTT